MRIRNTSVMIAMAVAAALAVLPGCGGGGGGGGGGGIGGNGGGNPATTLRTLKVGDQWTYSVTGTATSTTGQAASNVTGTITRSVVAKSLNGANTAIEEVSAFSFVGGGLAGGSGGGTTNTYFTQDASGNIVETGQDSTPLNGVMTSKTTTSAAANNVIIPGNWAQGQITQANITYSDGSNLTQQFSIGTGRSITVPAGTFAAWNVNATTNGSLSPETWDPQTGSYVTNTFTQKADIGGVTWTITTTAKLTQVTLQP